MSSDSETEFLDAENEQLSNTQGLNVVLIGESGVGKSALINQIYDRSIVESSNQAIGCTMESARVAGKLEDYPDLSLNLYDTAGLSESADGNIPTVKAFVQLIRLCYAIPGGVHLLIFCHSKGRISGDQFKANYRIFKEELCENKVPSLLVITNCDYDIPLNQWWNGNKDVIRNQLKFNFVDGVCVSTLKNRENDPNNISEAYSKSRRNLIQAIQEHASFKPVKIDTWKRQIMVYLRTIYNSFAEWLSWLGLQKLSLRPELEQMFIDLKYSPEAAKREAEELWNELHNPDLLGPYKVVNVDSSSV